MGRKRGSVQQQSVPKMLAFERGLIWSNTRHQTGRCFKAVLWSQGSCSTTQRWEGRDAKSSLPLCSARIHCSHPFQRVDPSDTSGFAAISSCFQATPPFNTLSLCEPGGTKKCLFHALNIALNYSPIKDQMPRPPLSPMSIFRGNL